MRITEHFTLSEVEKSQYALRHGLDNSLPEIYKKNATSLAENLLEPVRANFGIPFSPQSWFRGEELNKAIGGSKKSQHCTASAVDFEIPGITNLEIAIWIKENLIYDQLILECYIEGVAGSGWIHCSYAPSNKNHALRYDGKNYYQGLL